MKTLFVAALAMTALSGCGFGSPRPVYRSTYDNPCNYNQCGYPDDGRYVIDANVGVELPQNTLGITTNGIDWVLAWQGGAGPHEFSGSVYCDGCVITGARFDNAGPGDTVRPRSQSELVFSGFTDALVPQSLLFSVTGQPVLFDLYIDRIPAIGNVVFPSAGQAGTTNTMPFALAINGTTFAKKAEAAPQFVPTPPKDGEPEILTTVRAPAPLAQK